MSELLLDLWQIGYGLCYREGQACDWIFFFTSIGLIVMAFYRHLFAHILLPGLINITE